jgi:hypothetical protein
MMSNLPPDAHRHICAEISRLRGSIEAYGKTIVELSARLASNATVSTTSATSSALPYGCKPGTPPLFFGGKDAEQLDSWLFSMCEYFELIGLKDDEQRIRLAGTYLRSSATTWYRTARGDAVPESERVKTWDQFVKEIRSNFCPLNMTKIARDRLVHLHQTDTLREYVRSFRTLVLDIPSMAEDEKLDRFVRGLHPIIRGHVEIHEPDSFESAIRMAERFDVLERSASHYQADRPNGNAASHHSHSDSSSESGDDNTSSDSSSSGPEPMALGNTSMRRPPGNRV